MIAKDNQPSLLSEIPYQFHLEACFNQVPPSQQTLELGHGRIEGRRLWVLSVEPQDVDWPGVQQVFRIARRARFKKTGRQRQEVSYGLTSQDARQADAARLLSQVRDHWSIENRSHHVRDVTFDEDRSTVRSGNVPQVMAALR